MKDGGIHNIDLTINVYNMTIACIPIWLKLPPFKGVRNIARTHGNLHFSRSFSTEARNSIACVFDIDGVLLRGKRALDGARESLINLCNNNVPFVLLTNGGGEPEVQKARSLSEYLQFFIHPDQLILSHTPMRSLVHKYANKKVLVLGCRDVRSVAESYGFTRIYTACDLEHEDPTRYPFKEPAVPRKPIDLSGGDFGAVLVFHDPNDWGAEIQCAIDVLSGGTPLGSKGSAQVVPMYASNPDLIFPGEYGGNTPVPRLAAGSFLAALQAVWKVTKGTPLRITTYGKPSLTTYSFVQAHLLGWSRFAQEKGIQAMQKDIALGSHAIFSSQIDTVDSYQAILNHIGRLPKSENSSLSTSDTVQKEETNSSATRTYLTTPFQRIYMIGDNPKADILGTHVINNAIRAIRMQSVSGTSSLCTDSAGPIASPDSVTGEYLKSSKKDEADEFSATRHPPFNIAWGNTGASPFSATKSTASSHSSVPTGLHAHDDMVSPFEYEESDIWRGLLLNTGVHKGTILPNGSISNDPTYPAYQVFPDVRDAVNFVLRDEK